MKPVLRHDTSALPLALAALGIALLTGMDALVKTIAPHASALDLVAGRFAFGTLFALPLLARVPRARFSGPVMRAHALRTLLVLSTSLLFFYALGRLPLFEAIVLTFLSPIFMALLARFMLGERVARGTAAAIGVSFLGVLVIAWGQGVEVASFGRDLGGVLAALGATLTYALSLVLLRARTASDPIELIVGLQNVLAACVTVPVALVVGEPARVAVSSWPAFLAVGFLGTVGHLVYAGAFARAPAAKVATAEYTALIWAFLLGWFVFGDLPAASAVAGAALILCGSLLLVILRRVAEPPAAA